MRAASNEMPTNRHVAAFRRFARLALTVLTTVCFLAVALPPARGSSLVRLPARLAAELSLASAARSEAPSVKVPERSRATDTQQATQLVKDPERDEDEDDAPGHFAENAPRCVELARAWREGDRPARAREETAASHLASAACFPRGPPC